MSNENDKIEVSVGKDGLSLNLEGDPATNTGKGLADLFKPFVQWVGGIGDKIEHERNIRKQIRIFNQHALEASLKKALEIAEREGILPQPVPLKFLAQWAEGASLEDITEDKNLSSLWSNLLISASAGNSRNHNLFVDVLKKIDPEHARFLMKLIANGEDRLWVDYHSEWNETELRNYIIQAGQKIRADEILEACDEESIVEFTEAILTPIGEIPGVMFTLVMCFFYADSNRVRPPRKGTWDITIGYDHREFPEDIVDSLVSLNILQRIRMEDFAPIRSDCELVIVFIRLTNFGAQFMEACLAPDHNSVSLADAKKQKS